MKECDELTTYILQHKIGFYYDNLNITELPESEEEHIKEMIIEWYNQGELCYYDSEVEEEYRGWWKILH